MQTVPLATNAPPAWPEVRMDAGSLRPGAVPEGALRLQMGAAVTRALRDASEGVTVEGVRRRRLLDEGVLDVPVAVRDGGTPIAVFVYEAADDEAAAHFVGVRAACERAGEAPPVYYAPAPLPDRAPRQEAGVRALRSDDFAPLEGSPPEGTYAIWWPTETEDAFPGSRVDAALDRVVAALDGFASLAVAPFAARFGLVPEDALRVHLQGEPLVVPAQGPEGVPLLFTASREKGLGLRVHTERASPRYRDRLWTLFAAWCEQLRKDVARRDADPDPPEENGAPAWWARRRAELRATPGEAVGVTHVSGGPGESGTAP